MKVKYYLCEDVRQESNGKVILIGLYPDNTIIVSRPDKVVIQDKEVELTILAKLQIMLNISEFEGEVTVSGRFSQPGNSIQSGEQPIGNVVIPKGKSHNFVMDVSNFPAVGAGEYSFIATVNGEEFKFPIIIEYDE